MKACLTMSSSFHTPVDYWLNLPLSELHSWVAAAHELNKERDA